MKTSSTVLVLLALLLLIPCTQALAATQPAPMPAVAAAATPAPVAAKADFLASLAADPTRTAGDLAPAPSFVAGCKTDSQCPPGQLCCYPCGRFGCTNVCTVIPPGGQCPHYP
jgi:WAP-type (Whey Acidic Protein) 'four-disulfide core'